MKLPRPRRRPASDLTEPASGPGEPTDSSPAAAAVLEVLAYSRTDLHHGPGTGAPRNRKHLLGPRAMTKYMNGSQR